MKKLLSVVLALTLVLSLAACGGDNKGAKITLYEDTWEGDNVKLCSRFLLS